MTLSAFGLTPGCFRTVKAGSGEVQVGFRITGGRGRGNWRLNWRDQVGAFGAIRVHRRVDPVKAERVFWRGGHQGGRAGTVFAQPFAPGVGERITGMR